MNEINMIWPEWHEDCVLGAGSFGKVYRAKTTVNGLTHYCAVKMISVPKSADEIKTARNQGMTDNDIYSYFRSLVDNLLNEITLMESLKNSSNVVGIQDYRIIERTGEIGWDIYIRMELLTSFDKFIANPNLTTLDILKLGIDISAALIECERKMIVHRDIKPDNIFISSKGEFKLGDFGIARKMEASTANMSRKGTLNYMAPEIYKSEDYGSTVDIYSLGLVLYTLLNNNRVPLLPPYPQPITYEDNEKALSMRLNGAHLPPPCNTDSVISQIILKACEYLPQNRYQTAEEFRNALVYAYNYIIQNNLNRPISVSYQAKEKEEEIKDENDDIYAPENVDTSQGKAFRFSAICAASFLLLFALISLLESSYAVISLFLLATLPITILLTRENNISVGICCCLSFMPVAMVCIKALISLVQSGGGLDFASVAGCISALLMIFAGIACFRKKDVKTAGTTSVYALIAYIIRIVIEAANTASKISVINISYILFIICAMTFCFGYNKNKKSFGIGRILYFAAFIPALICFVLAAISLRQLFT